MPPKFITRKTIIEKATDGTYSQGRRITPRDPSFKENVLKAYLEEFSITEVEITVDTYKKFDEVLIRRAFQFSFTKFSIKVA